LSAPRDDRLKTPPGPEGSNGIDRFGRRGQPARAATSFLVWDRPSWPTQTRRVRSESGLGSAPQLRSVACGPSLARVAPTTAFDSGRDAASRHRRRRSVRASRSALAISPRR